MVLIGPIGSGKSSVGRKLAEILGWGFVELDDLRDAWYPEFGIDRNAERDAWKRGGLVGLTAFWKPFEVQSVERVMREHPTDTVIALGGGQSVYEDEAQFARVKAALGAASRVILLLPTENPEKAMDVLRSRLRGDETIRPPGDVDAFLRDISPLIAQQLVSASNQLLATEVVVTGHMSTGEVARHIATTHRELDEPEAQ